MREDVIEVAVRPREGQHHPALRVLGEPARSLPKKIRGDVRLLEVAVRGVENEGDLLFDLVPEDRAEARVGALGHPSGVDRGGALAFVEVDPEMLGLDHRPLQVLVLDLVLAEVLGRAHSHTKPEQDQDQKDLSCETDHDPALLSANPTAAIVTQLGKTREKARTLPSDPAVKKGKELTVDAP